MSFKVGDLVVSPGTGAFNGIAKVSTAHSDKGSFYVSFFRSPLRPSVDEVRVDEGELKLATLYDEQVIYCRNPTTNYWQRARYGGERPGEDHLIIVRSGDSAVVGIDEIYVLNMPEGSFPNPFEFLKGRCTDTPYFSDWRIPFIRSYISQRADCRSISSIPSSSVQLEVHQLAVVRRVLQDDRKKYLLADEVGLGKTIEAGLIIREQLLTSSFDSTVVIGVPPSLVSQWQDELSNRFHLGELIGDTLHVVEHDSLAIFLDEITPNIVIVDEAHQLSPWAWEHNSVLRASYQTIAAAIRQADTCLLLSGTPLIGNEKNFLSMLHLLSPDEYPIDAEGVEKFKVRVAERERLGGLYQAFVPGNDNGSLEDLLDQLESLFSEDEGLMSLAGTVRPHVDFFADEKSDARTEAILAFRKHIGEHYRLHQRMLRNRRDDPTIENLFPGLAGVISKAYEVKDEPYNLEQYLEDFRAEQEGQAWSGVAITKENYSEWVSAALTSPDSLGRLAQTALGSLSAEFSTAESELLRTIVKLAPTEQKVKDQALIEICEEIWREKCDAKLVMFCGDRGVAEHVFSRLQERFPSEVEIYNPSSHVGFLHDQNVKVLVCDHTGEDGLNLHGGRKFAIHYSLPISLPRIEQRLGRLNRYSAEIFASPVKSVVLYPKRGSFSEPWIKVLDQGVEVFDQSVASLQYVLEDKVELIWKGLPNEGPKLFNFFLEDLQGEDGLISRESRRVRAQEELNKLDDDIQTATKFAQDIEEGDAKAEQYVRDMNGWITEALQFARKKGEQPETFYFQYRTGVDNRARTLVDVNSLVRYCYPALEKNPADPTQPVTVMMSHSRDVVSHGSQIHPLRFGSPFLDVIYRFLTDDSRGIATGCLRYINVKMENPIPFLGITCLVSLTKRGDTREEYRKADEIFSPRIINIWLGRNGKRITDDNFVALLEKPYNQRRGGAYEDVNIRSERWGDLEDYFPRRHWAQTIDEMTIDLQTLIENDIGELPVGVSDRLTIEYLCARFVLLISKA